MATSPLSATFQARFTRLDSLCPGGVRDEQSSSAGAFLFETYCQCGCGEKTKIAKQTKKKDGSITGLSNKYILGHGTKKQIEDYIMEEPNSGCHLWIGASKTSGYGNRWHLGKLRLAHRLVYEMDYGEIPNGMTLDHLCRVRSCVNPKHLEIVTRGENVLRGNTVSALNSRKRCCPKCFSPYSKDTRQYRVCVNCSRTRWRIYSRNKRALKTRTLVRA